MSRERRFGVDDLVEIVSYTPKLGRQRARPDLPGRLALVRYAEGEWGPDDDPGYTVVLGDGERLAMVESELRAA